MRRARWLVTLLLVLGGGCSERLADADIGEVCTHYVRWRANPQATRELEHAYEIADLRLTGDRWGEPIRLDLENLLSALEFSRRLGATQTAEDVARGSADRLDRACERAL